MIQPLPKHRAREYETIFIINPESSTEAVEQVAGRMTDVIGRLDGKLLRAENWGRRRLAYPVRKHPKGIYIYLRYLGYSDLVLELERNIRMTESVIKHMTVKLDQDVNPEARPVREEDISFAPQFEETEEPEHTAGGHDSRYDGDAGDGRSHRGYSARDDHDDRRHAAKTDDVSKNDGEDEEDEE